MDCSLREAGCRGAEADGVLLVEEEDEAMISSFGLPSVICQWRQGARGDKLL